MGSVGGYALAIGFAVDRRSSSNWERKHLVDRTARHQNNKSRMDKRGERYLLADWTYATGNDVKVGQNYDARSLRIS
jgi:hypothetical protein